MFFDLKGWDTLLNTHEILHISVFPGVHKFIEKKEYTLFSTKTVWESDLTLPILRVWYKNDKIPFTFTAKDESRYEIYRSHVSPIYEQEQINKLLQSDYERLVEMMNDIKKALYVYENEEEDTPETTETVH